MTQFDILKNKISSWPLASQGPLKIYGANCNQWAFLFSYLIQQPESFLLKHSHIFISHSLDLAESLYQQLKGLHSAKVEVFFFPGIEVSPYQGTIVSEFNLLQRFRVLNRLVEANGRPFILISTTESFQQRLPPPKFFREFSFVLEVSDVISPEILVQRLLDLGYFRTPTVEEPGSFSKRGEIFDIFPISHPPIRLHFFDELIEEIYLIDLENQKTLRNRPLQQVTVTPTPQILSRDEFSRNLKTRIPMPATHQKNKYFLRKNIFQRLSQGQLFDNYPAYLPLFFRESSTLLDYFQAQDSFFHLLDGEDNSTKIHKQWNDLQQDYEDAQNGLESDCLLPPPDELYLEPGVFDNFLSSSPTISLNSIRVEDEQDNHESHLDFEVPLNLESIQSYLLRHLSRSGNKFDYIKSMLNFVKDEFKFNGNVLFSCPHRKTQEEIEFLLNGHGLSGETLKRIQFLNIPLDEGFYHPQSKTLVISEGDIFSHKKSKTKKFTPKKVDLFAEQLATLKQGDFVIHKAYGIGEYKGLETLSIGGQTSDFIVLHYEDRDKVYVPVYKMNYIQKYAEAGSLVKLNNLKTNKFDQIKQRAKKSVKALAFDLLKLQAERKSTPAFAFSPPDHFYREFELIFPFEETPDQLQAIHDVLNDLQQTYPMDRLICGDVGFGKTEVAMRAAFKAVVEKKQVAVLVPTTILALQHYNTFINRFKDFPINIEFISRFKSPVETKKILADLKDGKIDIIIGTHKLLGREVSFFDLGLVVIDEEQRFGVAHKEKLKLFKTSVHVLSLSATPIPRTLQLGFLGIRELSLIQTPPPKRQSIKTYLIKDDAKTIRDAIERELQRGGQVFYVHNRVQNIEQLAAKIREWVPSAKVLIAHGQLSEKELEKRMSAFFQGQYNVLVATTIIESGLDIPNANTLIVNKAEAFGLSQLHQLRGRIGRSDKKAYAYFVISKENNLSTLADQRLKALQTYASIGSGFALASCDLEIRGAGDILGAEQSGHIESIGLELYTELLSEAISELKGENPIPKVDLEIQVTDPSYIPHSYVEDPGERLKYYKKLSNCHLPSQLDELQEEMQDLFGPTPEPLSTLILILKVRLQLQGSGLKTIKVIGDKIYLKFDKALVDATPQLQDRILETFMKRPKVYKFNPDYSVTYSHKGAITKQDLVNFSKNIAEQIIPC